MINNYYFFQNHQFVNDVFLFHPHLKVYYYFIINHYFQYYLKLKNRKLFIHYFDYNYYYYYYLKSYFLYYQNFNLTNTDYHHKYFNLFISSKLAATCSKDPQHLFIQNYFIFFIKQKYYINFLIFSNFLIKNLDYGDQFFRMDYQAKYSVYIQHLICLL